MQFINVPFSVLAIAMSAMTAVIIFTLEWFFPWKEELFVSSTHYDKGLFAYPKLLCVFCEMRS